MLIAIESLVQTNETNHLDILDECGYPYHGCSSKSSLRPTRPIVAHAGL
jgi:hypothetical protein